MTEPLTGEQKTTENAEPDIPLSKAVDIVLKAISDENARLSEITNGLYGDNALLEGETFTSYTVHVMVDSAKVAQTMLKYQYPFFNILKEDAPQKMWDELAEIAGLRTVYSVDM